MINKREEDYLKVVYTSTVEKSKSLVPIAKIANNLEVTVQTANEMIKKLSLLKLVNYAPYKGVSLTEKGLVEAIRVIRAHRIIEVFLTETLKFNWSEVHEDAEKLEHATSEKVINALEEFLGNPLKDPHGHPIPKYGKDYNLSTLKLTDLKKGDIFKIIRINESEELFIFLNEHNILINDQFTVVSNKKEDKTIKIEKEEVYIIKKDIAKNIFVELKK